MGGNNIEHYAANELLNRYCEILGITKEQGREIFKRNKTVRLMLSGPGLEFCNQEKFLDALLRSTLFREVGDRGPITQEEIKIVKEYYDIDILEKKN